MTVLENGEFLSIDPFGKTRSRTLPAVPAAISPLGGGETPDTLIFYQTGAVDILRRDGDGNQTLLSGAFPSLPAPPLAAVSRKDLAALTLTDGRVLLLSGSGGRILRTVESHLRAGETPPDKEVSMIFDERGIYVLSRSGASGFTEDGRRLWILELTGTAAIPAFSDEGILFAGGEDWILYAYQPEYRGDFPRSSPYGSSPGTYGLGGPPPLSWADYALAFGEIDTHLEQIRRDIFAGRLGENERDYTAYLMALSGSFIRTPGASVVRPPVHIRHRIAGARLLGYIGSRETIPFLVSLLYYEPEALVKLAAAEAIGRIGLDPEGIALEVFSAMLSPPVPEGDDRVLTAIAAATGTLCRFSGPPLSARGIKILTTLTESGYPPMVRERAREELNALRR
jgi:outer membrane protein assembly factor BamB